MKHLLLLGGKSTGKSTFLQKLLNKEDTSAVSPTLVPVSKIIPLVLGNQDEVDLSCWEVPYTTTSRQSFLQRANVILYFFSFDSSQSLVDAETLLKEDACHENAKAIKILVGTKAEIPVSERVVRTEQAERLANRYNMDFEAISLKKGGQFATLLAKIINALRSSDVEKPLTREQRLLQLAEAECQHLWFDSRTSMKNIEAILNDYAKGDSFMKKLVTFHWGRTNTYPVNVIVKNIGIKYHTPQDVLDALSELEISQGGSLNKRIMFIRHQLGMSLEPSTESCWRRFCCC